MSISTNGVVLTRLAGALYNTQLSNATYEEVKTLDPSTLANALITRDFATATDASVATTLVANLGLSAVTGLNNWVAAQLTAAGSAKGAKIVEMLNSFAQMSADATYGTAATAFNTKVTTALAMAQTAGNAGGTFADVGVASTQATYILTSGLNVITTKDGNKVYADEDTLTSGDNITGDGDVELDLTTASISGQNISGADSISIESTGGSTVRASDWTGIGALIINNSTGNVTVNDQQALTPVTINDHVDAAATATLNYDSQVVSGTADDLSVTVSEMTSTLAVSGGNVEELTLTIADVTGAVSTLTDLTVAGIKTLEIKGGTAGLAFGITGALDTTLTTISAGTAASNLTLSVTEALRTMPMSVTLGTGSDTLNTGNTLDTDTIVGGEGSDNLTATFTTVGTRMPTMSGVEKATVVFSDSATIDGAKINDLAEVVVNTSTYRIALRNMDNTLKTLTVNGLQAGSHTVDYSSGQDADLSINWTSSRDDSDAGTITVNDVQTLTATFKGEDDVTFSGNLALDNTDTDNLTISNTGLGDVTWGSNDIATSAALANLTLKTSNNGSITIEDMATATSLENITITASEGNITINDFGATVAAAELDTVTVTANGNADVSIGVISATGATLSYLSVNADADSTILFDSAITVEDIEDLTIVADDDAQVNFDAAITASQINEITVSGAGSVSIDGANVITTLDNVTTSGMTTGSAFTAVFSGTTSAVTYALGVSTNTVTLGKGASTLTVTTGTDQLIMNPSTTGLITITGMSTSDAIDLGNAAIESFADAALSLGTASYREIDAAASVSAADNVVIATVTAAADLSFAGAGTNVLRLSGDYASATAMLTAISSGGTRALTLDGAFDGGDEFITVLWDDGTDSYLSVVSSDTNVADDGLFLVANMTSANLIKFVGIADSATITAAMLGTAIIA